MEAACVISVSHMGKSTPEEKLDELAAGPKRATGDQGSIEQFSISEYLEYVKYKASVAAQQRPGLGVIFKKLVPPGAE